MRSPKVSFDDRLASPKMPPLPRVGSSARRVDNAPVKVSVADLSSALIREYLVTLGYRKTLESLVKEDFIRKETKIEDRVELFELLGLDNILDRSIDTTKTTFLEIIVQKLLAVKNNKDMNFGDKSDLNKLGNGEIVQTAVTSLRKKSGKKGWEDAPPKKFVDLSDSAPILGAFDTANPCAITRPIEATQLRIRRPKSSAYQTDIIVDDFNADEFDSEDELSVPVSNLSTWAQSRGTPISSQILQDLNSIIFPPRGKSTFGEEWLGKGFVFRDEEELKYGLIQLKGGPCGLLAAVQAFIVRHLVYEENMPKISLNRLRPNKIQARKALVEAMAEILTQASKLTKKMVLVVQGQGKSSAASGVGTLSGLEMHEFTDPKVLRDFIEATLSQFMANSRRSNGLVQFLLSLILSRGIENIRNDMDERDGRLMGRHSYCTQEMVNLVLVGAAISNLHDGNLDLGGDPPKILKGIHLQPLVGQLSLFEHYQNLKVGEYCKSPKYPIWVICSESHYTVAFGLQQIASNSSAPFDIFYYDGLANQQQEIRLTLIPNAGKKKSNSQDLASPIENCLKTKWPTAKLDWNGTEALL